MDQILAEFVSLPRPVIYAVFGGIGGIIGAVISGAVLKIFKTKSIATFITIICIVVSIQLANHILPVLERSVGSVVVMNELKQYRVFQVIFRLHPEAEVEMKAKMQEILKNSPDNQVMLHAQAASAEIVAKYFTKHLSAASDEYTHALLARQLDVLKQFKDRPSLCVGYYLGQPQFDKDDLSLEFIEAESNMKADIIESAVNNPSRPPQAATIEIVAEELADAYQQRGYSIDDLVNLEQVGVVSAEKGCDLAIKFSDVLASMSPDRASYIFKNLLYAAEQQK